MPVGEPGAGSTDAELIAAVRDGSADAYGELYNRHLPAARSLARHLTSSPAAADDAVSESFTRMLEVLQAGGGPDEAFRAYLLRSLRNNVYDRARREKKESLTDDIEQHAPSEEFTDVAEQDLERSLATRAFRRLPERWQKVIWHTAVEEQSPGQVAAILGTSPNNVTSLAYRAREGLRQAYLDSYLADGPDGPCTATIRELGSYVRDGLSARTKAKVEEHLAGCADCRRLLGELREVSGTMRPVGER